MWKERATAPRATPEGGVAQTSETFRSRAGPGGAEGVNPNDTYAPSPSGIQAEEGAGPESTIEPAGGRVKDPQAPLYSRATAATATLPGLLDNGNVPRVREWFAPKLDAARVKLQHKFLMLKRRQQAEIGFVEPEWAKAIPCGHTAIARVSLDGESRTTLSLYTLQPSKSDQWLTKVRMEGMDEDRVFLHGLTCDYFSIVKALRDWETGRCAKPRAWQQIEFPIAMVVFGESEVGPRERSKNGASDWTRCPGALSSQV